MDALNCTYDDYQKAAGFSGLSNLVKARPRLGKFFKIENGGMRLPSVHRRILANPSLDQFAMSEFKKFADPNARLFGENTFTIAGVVNNYRIGHLERYCGPTLRMNIDTMRTISGGTIAALAHTHPLFKGINASSLNRDGEHFGPADWIPLVAFQCPTYLHTPRRRTYVMEYNGDFIVVRNLAGGEKKWRVSYQ
jgi:hypothetical protein